MQVGLRLAMSWSSMRRNPKTAEVFRPLELTSGLRIKAK